jgi:TonB family protein
MIYLIKSSLILSIVFVLFQCLRNDISFKRNRIILVAGAFLSLVLPLINFSAIAKPEISQVIVLSPVTITTDGFSEAVHHNFPLFYAFILVYFTGVVFLFIKRVTAIFKIARLVRTSDLIKRNGHRLVLTDDDKSPFSFFNIIFINRNLSVNEAETIITHEYAHITKYHSVDVLFMELLVIIQWINPFVWFYRTSLREVHEYQADRSTLNNGIEKSGYIQLLLAMALNTSPDDLTNSFCQIKLKRRLKMITKIKNSRFSGLKLILTVPVLVLFLWVVSCDNTNKTGNTSDVPPPSSLPDSTKAAGQPSAPNSVASEGTDEVFTVVDDMPKYPGGDEARVKFIVSNIKYPQVAKEKGVQGTVIVSFVIDNDGSVKDAKVLRGIGAGCDEEALRVIKMMPKWTPGKQSGKNVKVAFNMPVKFALS